MAKNDNIPTGNTGLGVNFLPDFYQTPANKKFLQATIDQLYQPGTITKTSGFIGRENAKASTGTDVYVESATTTRQNYQLEPGITIKDSLGNVTFFKDYQDYINQLNVFGANTKNHARLNKQELYSWDPHIDWDKFVNFQDYYWLPYGPDVVNIYGQQQNAVSTYTVVIQSEGDVNEYLFTPNGLDLNPTIKLYRGQTYKFNITSPANPFSIKTARLPGIANRYNIGVSDHAVTDGVITFTVPVDAPNLLYYQSESDSYLGGAFEIYDYKEDSAINVTEEVLGKKTYTLSDGTVLSNGMKVAFKGNVLPEKYATGRFYVEGVGVAIKLIPESILEIISPYTTNESIEFSSTPFDTQPFDDATGFATLQDYVVINRASKDHNPWSRYNRWFHKDVITASAIYNKDTPNLDQTARATRPIIEFQADLKLFNMGTSASIDIDLVDDFTKDLFSTIEGARGYNIDGVSLVHGQKILFLGDNDPLVKGNIYEVGLVNISGYNQITLTQVATPSLHESVLVLQGIKNQSLMYWFNGTEWVKGQQKTNTNQAPLFDIVDNNGISYGDTSVYTGSTFTGTAVFSYSKGTGANDTILGFPLSYQNVANIGDIVFQFDLAIDTFNYKVNSQLVTKKVAAGYLISSDYTGNAVYVNGWQVCNSNTIQAAVRIYKNSKFLNNFPLDIFDDITNLSDLIVRVYVDGYRVDPSLWKLVDGTAYKNIQFTYPPLPTEVVTIKAYAAQPINSNGYYEIPVNLQNNSLNADITQFTLGEVTDHLTSIVDNLPANEFIGAIPGDSNLRDLGNITPYGTKFVQHSGPLSLAMYHITSESNNVIKALETARDDYSTFKRNFIEVASSLGVDGNPIQLVELILQKVNASKPTTAPYYFSDMVPYGANTTTNLKVVDYRIKTYPLSAVFSLDTLSNKAVGVYLNGTQLVYGQDYTFNSQGFVEITSSVALTNGDTITTIEYDSTDGCYVPSTPTKLGMWPAYVPKIYLDTTLLTPVNVIQGHDGSIITAYGDYRDALILELETRIFNNIKVKYDPSVFNVADVMPGYTRTSDYSLKEFNQVLAPSFYQWSGLVGIDFTQPLTYDRNNPFTYNYSGDAAPNGEATPGFWRGVYRWMLDTDRPHLCPWEMLGFSIQPNWWATVYGPAPYTSDNLILWTDLSTGTIREPGKPLVVVDKYIRPFLLSCLPVNENGDLLSPIRCGLAKGIVTISTANDFVFGDVSPIEAAWRRSSYYPFSVIIASMMLTPAKTFGLLLDRSRIVRNKAGQLVYKDTNLRIQPSDILVPSIYASTTRVQTAGIVNYIVDLILNIIFSNNQNAYKSYQADLQSLTPQLSYRVGAFTNQNQFNLLLESKTPSATGNVFIPKESYQVFLNSSSPTKKITYSGVIITKLSTGFEVKGYSKTQPYFEYYDYMLSGTGINVGGISESVVTWTPGQQYIVGQVVQHGTSYYRTVVKNVAGINFDKTMFAALPSLPIVGGVTTIFRDKWNKNIVKTAPYGTQFASIQEVVDFLLGYEQYLIDQGFVFNDFNEELNSVANWETSAKEFMFWTTQSWAGGETTWTNWAPNHLYSYGTIVRYNGEYYSAQYNIPELDVFDTTQWLLLPGLSNVGSSVISLSPAANAVTFKTNLTVVDNIANPFNRYEIFKVDSTPIQPSEIDSYRENNVVTYRPRNNNGIYCASFYLIQNEHVVIIDNTDIFNDIIYNPPSGYRRERIKLSGYVTEGWYGGLDIPGFIFDGAKVQNWQPWQDYNMADIIAYQGHYYSANQFIAGDTTFVPSLWTRLSSQPSSQLMPNWTNTATQFIDFYGLDIDNFNTQQQKFAQHLVGYQTRQYLNNIIQDPVSEFKFYQGMIRDKGTQNVLNHLFGVLNNDNAESLTFYEEWAIRVGQYGAANAFESVEVIIDQNTYKNNPQGYYLTSRSNNKTNSVINNILPNDVYVKPLGYNNQPFPVLTNPDPVLRSAGYVNPVDSTFKLGTLYDLYKLDSNNAPLYPVSALGNGQYVWTAFSENTWNVYRFTDLLIRVLDVTYNSTNSTLTITTQNLIPIKAGEFVGLGQVSSLEGFYEVTSVALNSFTVKYRGSTSLTLSSPFAQAHQLVVYGLVTQRTSSMDTLDNLLLTHLRPNTLVWTDDDGDGRWAVWKYNPVYVTQNIPDATPTTNFNFGISLSVNTQGSILAVSNSQGTVSIYDKIGRSVKWVARGYLLEPFVSKSYINPANHIATVSAVSADGTWLVTGSPLASNAATTYKGIYNISSTYAIGSIVSVQNSTNNYSYYKALRAVPINTPTTSTTHWYSVPYISVDEVSGTDSGLTAQGVISIYLKDLDNNYNLVNTITSPLPTTNENFGSSFAFGNNTLYVGATGYNSGAGRVYKLSFSTTVQVETQYNPVGSINSTLAVTSTAGIRAGMIVQGTGFSKGQVVEKVLSATTLALSGTPDTGVIPAGMLQFVTTDWAYNWSENYIGTGTGALGTSIVISNDTKTLAITEVGKVHVYKDAGNGLTSVALLTGDDTYFGKSVAISSTGTYLAISDDTSGDVSQQGGVTIYSYANDKYTAYQSLVNHQPETNGLFGNKIAFMSDDTVVVYSKNGDSTITTTFDGDTTTFDKSSTNFLTIEVNSGRVDIYDRYHTNWVFSESLESTNLPSDGYGTGFAVGANQVIVSAPTASDQTLASGQVYSYSKPNNSYSWSIYEQQDIVPDVKKVRKAFLYDRVDGNLITYLDVVDPLQGKIPGPAQEEISYQTFYDPASYSYSDGTVDVVMNSKEFWADLPVGQLWWDLRTSKFLENNFNDPAYRNSAWNTLAAGASVDIYEWVSTNLLPANWDKIADTPSGIAIGISGQSLYGNSAYCVTQVYDNISKSFRNTYYFWVKNKKIVPTNLSGRNMAASDVASLIANPRAQGYTCLALTGVDSFSLINAAQYLKGTNVVLAVEYWTIDKTDQNVHSQWKLISNDTLVNLPATIEQKWFDSLCGIDAGGRAVPDPSLAPKLRYGIENRPRQSMFVNRVEALKQFIETVNTTLKTYQTSELKNISSLESYDPIPNTIYGLYDKVVDTYEELGYASIGYFSVPELMPIIDNGTITGITVVNSGKGYVYAPYISISGTGTGANIRATINALGEITGATIIKGGEGYGSNTQCSVRGYSVLVRSDSTSSDTWSIYAYDTTTKEYTRVLTQGYDVRKYWSYADWYATGFNQFSAPDITVDNFVDLNTAQDIFFRQARNGTVGVGQLVKVLNGNANKWVLLYRYSSVISVDWTQSYRVVGIQDGTIQFNTNLYNFSGTDIGYDSSIFNTSNFDVQASAELRIILNTIKNNILIDDLKQQYLDLFLSSLHYAHSEQPFIDWAFKTSFVRATHNVGGLSQPVNYPVDNLNNFQDYVAEVKPYRTKIREYVSQYTGIDTDQSAVTDFDLQPNYVNTKIRPIEASFINNKISVADPAIQTYPWKFWNDNVGFSVIEIKIVDGGSGYANAPQVIIDQPTGPNAQVATARAYITNGVVNRIILTNADKYGRAGTGYLSAPSIILDGGLTIGGVAAKAVAIIGDSVVRSALTELKFDRVDQTYYLANLQQVDTFTGSGSKLQFSLTWAPDIRAGESTVTVNGIPVLRELYSLSIVKATVSGYTQYTGKITFVTAPASGSAIIVKYNKAPSVLTAVDRIQYYYNPTTGQLGKDLGQLMTGVDYGGVVVSGLGFEVSGGWGSSPYLTDSWDSRPATFKDYSVQVSGNTHVFILPYTPANGTAINIYFSRQITESYVSDGIKTQYAYDLTLLDVSVNVVTVVTATTITADYVASQVVNGVTFNSGGYTLVVSDTTGIVPGMIVSGTGFSLRQKVVNVINGTTLTIDNVANTAPSGTLTFSNIAGGFVLTVSSTSGLAVGDVVTASTAHGTIFAYGTTVTAINSATSVTLNQILYSTVASGTTITFTKNLVEPTDVAINASGTIQLLEPYAAGSTINIIGQKPPVRIDDPYYGMVASNNWAGSTVYAVNSLVLVNSISYICKTAHTSSTTWSADFAQGYWQSINTSAVIPTPVIGVSVITNILEGGAGGASLTISSFSGVDDGGSASTTNATVIDGGIIDDAPTNVIEIPADFVVLPGDEFILRESSSDGSIASPDSTYDTLMDGGNLAYSTATGIAADDIVVDGDGFTTPTSSPAPEEVVPGQVVDALAIKVYDKAQAGSAVVKVNSHIADGTSASYDIGQTPNSSRAIIVKLDSTIKTYGTDYTIDYSKGLVTFVSTPTLGQLVTIFSIGFNGANILDLDYFVGDGTTREFVTRSAWVSPVTSLIYVDGLATSAELFKTDNTYAFNNAIGIRFITPPPAGKLVNFIIVSGEQQTFATTKTERISSTGASTYTLQYPIGVALPNESNVIVRVNQNILTAPVNSYYVIANSQLIYTIDPSKALPYSATPDSIYVYADGHRLSAGSDYVVDPSKISINITETVYSEYEGKSLVISLTANEGYNINPVSNQITFAQGSVPSVGDIVEVISNYRHEILDIERTEIQYSSSYSLTPGTIEFFKYNALGGGLIQLDRPVINADYVWVIKNQILLTVGVDYKLNEDLQSLRLTKQLASSDILEIITFGSNILPSAGISYMQFKDMLNRVSYKRLNANKKTILVQDLKWNDTSILVADASQFDQPNAAANRPGVIEIRGERIEYFKISGNTLSQLRRGTLGTGVYNLNKVGAIVQGIGASENIPYTDTTITETVKSSGLGVPRTTGSVLATASSVAQPISYFNITSTTGQLSLATGNYYVGQVISISGQPVHSTLNGIVSLGTNGRFSCLPSTTTLAIGQSVIINNSTANASLLGLAITGTSGQFTCTSSPVPLVVGQKITMTGLIVVTQPLVGVTITGTSGQFACTYSNTLLQVGQTVTISGSFTSGSILGYTSPTTYTISSTDGHTSFTLITAPTTFTNIPATNIVGTGTGAVFKVVAANKGYTVTITSPGSGYAVNNTMLVLGSALGGTNTTNDLLITVAGVSNGQITSVSVKGISEFGDPLSTTVGVPSGITCTLTAGSGGIQNYVAPKTYQISETNGSTSFTLTTTTGQALVTTVGIPSNGTVITSGLNVSINSGSITGYVGNQQRYYIVATNGLTSFTLSASYGGAPITTTLGSMYGQQYAVSAATINNYSSPTDYYVVATNGTSTVTLSQTPNGTPVTTTIGTPTGLVASVPNSVITISGTDELTALQKFVVTGSGGGGLTPGVYYVVNPKVGTNQITVATTLELAKEGKPISTLSNATLTNTSFTSGGQDIALGFIPSSADEIEVFVGGYNTVAWTASTEYAVGTLVSVGAYTYRCTTAHTSSAMFGNDLSNWHFFVENIRLRKSEYSVFNINKAPYSPAGDVSFSADFIVDGTSASLTLTNPLTLGTQVTVVKRTGNAWDGNKYGKKVDPTQAPSINILNDSSAIANFIKAEPGIWYSEYTQISTIPTDTFDSAGNTFDTISQTFDQGT
jgi:hypothetical protein